MENLVGVLFTTLLTIGAFYYSSVLLGIAAGIMVLTMIDRFDKENL